INSWPVNRTEDETRAFIEANQKQKDEQQARIDAYEAEGRKLWSDLGRASGMDVDKLKAQAEAERAAAKAAEEAKAKELLKQVGAAPVDE
ncbi:MAG: hypothetical protein GXC70_12455, partial [Sphingomonadaceae bacterium]|nr:hypothetical protein [Sphingomonadaceae bacterium]